MVNNTRNGCIHDIRKFVAEHPGSNVAEIAAGTNWGIRAVGKAVDRMARNGMMTKARANNKNVFTLARAPHKNYKDELDTTKKRQKKRDRSAYYKAKREEERVKRAAAKAEAATPKPKPVRIKPHGQTVEEFLANGGKIERIPAVWEAYQMGASR